MVAQPVTIALPPIIVPGASIGGIGPRGQRDARKLLGRPDKSDGTVSVYKRAALTVFRNGADGVETGSPRYRTAAGIHVGSRLSELKRAYKAIDCDRYACRLGIHITGSDDHATLVAPTTFELRRLRVTRIDIGQLQSPNVRG